MVISQDMLISQESGITAPLTVPLKVLYPLQRSDGSFIIQGLWLWQS